jgi:hypothetical protein
MTKRRRASPPMAARYGGSWSSSCGTIAWSIARWMRIGIVIEISV